MGKEKILITREDFIKLVSGKVVERDNVEILLQDIGYISMSNIITKLINQL